jgi:hypothetical protein
MCSLPQDLHAIAEAVPRAERDVHPLTSHGALKEAMQCIVNRESAGLLMRTD